MSCTILTQDQLAAMMDNSGRVKIEGNLEVTTKLNLRRLQLDVTGVALFADNAYLWSITTGGTINARRSIKTEGSIRANSIETGMCLAVREQIEARNHINAGMYVVAGESITAGGTIKAIRSVRAGGSIKAGESIQAGVSIKAGWPWPGAEREDNGAIIEAGRYILPLAYDAHCKYLVTKSLPYGPAFYAALPPFANFAAIILSRHLDDFAWMDQLKTRIHGDAAKQICEWEGWHPLLRAQLQMFFGLRQQVPGEEFSTRWTDILLK